MTTAKLANLIFSGCVVGFVSSLLVGIIMKYFEKDCSFLQGITEPQRQDFYLYFQRILYSTWIISSLTYMGAAYWIR